jgi:hypothetical protein
MLQQLVSIHPRARGNDAGVSYFSFSLFTPTGSGSRDPQHYVFRMEPDAPRIEFVAGQFASPPRAQNRFRRFKSCSAGSNPRRPEARIPTCLY